jgi:putative protein-disulfide isomerase
MAVVHTRYYTDPCCPWSWALEPSLRRLVMEFGSSLRIQHVMAGMGSSLEDPSSFVMEALQAGERSGMPVNVRPWLQDPPSSSHPACMAVKAADEQGQAEPYLRRLREGFFCRGHKLDNADGLLGEARALPELDLERFRIALGSHGVLELLASDLEEARRTAPEEHSEGADRVKLPSLEFRGQDGQVHGVYGYSRYDTLREAALAAGGVADPATPSIEEALSRFGSLATVEVAEVCRLPGPTAPAALWKMAAEWRVRAERCGGGELWSLGESS